MKEYKIYDFPFGYLVQNACICWFLVDYSLLPADINISWLNAIIIISFTSEKVVRTRGEPQKMLFSGVQSHHLRNAKIQGSTGWNCLAPNMTHWEASNNPRTIYSGRIHHHKAFGPYLGPFWHPQWLQKDQLPPKKPWLIEKHPSTSRYPGHAWIITEQRIWMDNTYICILTHSPSHG